MEIKDRLQVFLKNQNINAAQFADSIQVQRSSISHILSGRNKPSIEFLEKLLNKYKDIDIHWLLTGKSVNNVTNNNDLQLNFVNSNKQVQSEIQFEQLQMSNSGIQEKKIEKIITFYTDKTFTVYNPE